MQDAQLQCDALTAAGCGRVFEEKVSTRSTARPELAAALDYLRPDDGDVLAVWKLDRLGRSVKDVLTIADDLHERKVGLRILAGKLVGTYSPTGEGKFFFTMMAAFAELERDILQERTLAGLAAARAQGRVGGRPTVMDADKLAAARPRPRRGRARPRSRRRWGCPGRVSTGTWPRPSNPRPTVVTSRPVQRRWGEDNRPVLNLRNHPSVNSPRNLRLRDQLARAYGSCRSVHTSSVGWPAAPGTRHHRGPCPGELKPTSSRSMTVCTRHSVARACRYVLARTVLHAKVDVGAQQAEDFHTAGVVPPVGRMACQTIARWWRCRRGGCGIFATMTWIRRLRFGIRAGRARNPLRCSWSRR